MTNEDSATRVFRGKEADWVPRRRRERSSVWDKNPLVQRLLREYDANPELEVGDAIGITLSPDETAGLSKSSKAPKASARSYLLKKIKEKGKKGHRPLVVENGGKLSIGIVNKK